MPLPPRICERDKRERAARVVYPSRLGSGPGPPVVGFLGGEQRAGTGELLLFRHRLCSLTWPLLPLPQGISQPFGY